MATAWLRQPPGAGGRLRSPGTERLPCGARRAGATAATGGPRWRASRPRPRSTRGGCRSVPRSASRRSSSGPGCRRRRRPAGSGPCQARYGCPAASGPRSHSGAGAAAHIRRLGRAFSLTSPSLSVMPSIDVGHTAKLRKTSPQPAQTPRMIKKTRKFRLARSQCGFLCAVTCSGIELAGSRGRRRLPGRPVGVPR
jgi:hypothetical protein